MPWRHWTTIGSRRKNIIWLEYLNVMMCRMFVVNKENALWTSNNILVCFSGNGAQNWAIVWKKIKWIRVYPQSSFPLRTALLQGSALTGGRKTFAKPFFLSIIIYFKARIIQSAAVCWNGDHCALGAENQWSGWYIVLVRLAGNRAKEWYFYKNVFLERRINSCVHSILWHHCSWGSVYPGVPKTLTNRLKNILFFNISRVILRDGFQ